MRTGTMDVEHAVITKIFVLFFCTTCVLLKSIIYLITLNFDMSIKGLMDSFSDADKAAEKLDYEINDVTLTVLYK